MSDHRAVLSLVPALLWLAFGVVLASLTYTAVRVIRRVTQKE